MPEDAGVRGEQLIDRLQPNVFVIEGNYDRAEANLVDIFAEAEAQMAFLYPTLNLPNPNERLTEEQRALINIAVAQLVARWLEVGLSAGSPGEAWIQVWSDYSGGVGTDRLSKTLVEAVDLRMPNAARLLSQFENFTDIAEGVVGIGRDQLVNSFELHGQNLASYFRDQFSIAVNEGIPMVGSGDTLANRLFDGGRIRDLEVQTTNGPRLIKAETRAKMWARTELNRIETNAYFSEADRLGATHYANRNPLDNRTSTICRKASSFGVRTVKEWNEWARKEKLSTWLPPRHPNCRSRIIAFIQSWLGLQKL